MHVKKIKMSQLGGMQSHLSKRDHVRTNQDIDVSRSHLNYELDGMDGEHLVQHVHQRIKEAGVFRKVRGDAVGLEDFIIGASHDWMMSADRSTRDAYFHDALVFLRREFGAENVMYACVHMDEPSIQMHVGIVPLCKDEKGRMCLSAKKVLTKFRLRELHTKFWHEVSEKYGLERGGQNKNDEYTDIWEFKKKAESALAEAHSTVADIRHLGGTARFKERLLKGEDKTVMEIPTKSLVSIYRAAEAGVSAVGMYQGVCRQKEALETRTRVLMDEVQEKDEKIKRLQQRVDTLRIYDDAPDDVKDTVKRTRELSAYQQHVLHRDCVRAFLCSGRDLNKAVELVRPKLVQYGMKTAADQKAYVRACLSAARHQSKNALTLNKEHRLHMKPDYVPVRENMQSWHPAPTSTNYLMDDAADVSVIPLRVSLDPRDEEGVENWTMLSELTRDEILAKRAMRDL